MKPQRLRTEIALERHDFHAAAAYSEALTQQAPNDSWNWGTLGDAMTELGNYDNAAEAYQKMVNLRPDLSSYNRAAYFRFLYGDAENGTKIMKMAIAAGSPMAENTAWCQVELGKMYLKTGRLKEAEDAYSAALRNFPNYHPALAGLAQTQASKHDWKSAIANMKRAQASVPMPDYASALYDYYTASGDAKEAKKQKELIEVTDQVGQAAQEKSQPEHRDHLRGPRLEPEPFAGTGPERTRSTRRCLHLRCTGVGFIQEQEVRRSR